MTRLLFLAACFTSALATMHAGSGYGGSMEKGNGDQKNTMSKDQKNAMDKASGSSKAVADSSVKVMSSYKGGMATAEKIAEPAMAKGMTHKVSLQSRYCRMGSNTRSFRSS